MQLGPQTIENGFPSITAKPISGECGWCGMWHNGICPSVKSIEYNEDGSIRRVEFK